MKLQSTLLGVALAAPLMLAAACGQNQASAAESANLVSAPADAEMLLVASTANEQSCQYSTAQYRCVAMEYGHMTFDEWAYELALRSLGQSASQSAIRAKADQIVARLDWSSRASEYVPNDEKFRIPRNL